MRDYYLLNYCAMRTPSDYEYCCTDCGRELFDGDTYYEIDDNLICDECMQDKYRRTMRVEEYTKEDYLTEKYERERHDV